MDGVNPVEGVEVKNSSELIPPTSYNLFSLNSQGQPAAPIKAAQPAVGSIKSPIEHWLKELHAKYHSEFQGNLASYIPELTKADPAHFGIALATPDGQV